MSLINIFFHPKNLEKEGQSKPKERAMKVRMEVHKIQNRKTIDRINENETDKFSATLMKKKREKVQITRIRNKREDITANIMK